ncbi:MAG: hypothetical protein Q9M43_02160 [Sulfurimonas sp.]|nr:hypothetical protein [Sulfurimonas sp.]
MADRKIGMWMYSNGGGDKIAKKIIKQLADRDIEAINNLRLQDCICGSFINLCQSGKITNTQGNTDEYRNRCREICS